VEILQTLAQLLDKEPSSVYLNWLKCLVPHILVKRYPAHVLLNYEYFLLGFKVVMDLADICMFQLFHACDFVIDCFPLGRIVELEFRIDLDGYSLLCFLVLSQFDLCVSPLAKHSNNLVLIELVLSFLLSLFFREPFLDGLRGSIFL